MLRLRISRLEGVAIAVLAVVITGVLVVKRFVRNDSAYVLTQPTDKQFEEYRKFTVARQERDDNHHGFSTPAVHAARLFRFNPNTADSATFVMLGLRPRQAMAIIHYRNAGGRFRKKEDFKRIYTISEGDYGRLSPYIKLPQGKSFHVQPVRNFEHHVEKLANGETVDLNCGDTAQLKLVPGVGSVMAGRIVRYGKLLGGYVKAEQVAEVYGLDMSFVKWFSVKAVSIQKININTAGYAQIVRHPYFNKVQTKYILKLRQEWGRINSLKVLENDTVFTPMDINRIKPYVDL